MQMCKSRFQETPFLFLQAAARGFLERRRLFLLLQHYSDNEDRVVRAQSAWRGAIARRRFRSVVRRAQEADRAR